MKEDRRPQEICVIWVDHTNRIISFRKEDGFEPRAFLSPDEQMQYALEKYSIFFYCIMQGIGFPSRNGKFFGMILFTRTMPAALPPQQLQKLDDHHGAEGQSYDGPHHPSG